MLNPGWPGCCRPPQPHELDKILPADWPAVNAVHRTPIPSDIKQLLDSLKQSSGSPTISPTSPNGGSYLKDVSNKVDRDRKNGNGGPQQRMAGSPNGTLRTHVQKSRPSMPMGGSSPQSKQARLGGSGTPPANFVASPSDASSMNSNSVRKAGHADVPLKRIEGFRTTPPGGTRKLCSENDSHQQGQTENVQRSPTLTRTSRDGGSTPVRTSPTTLPKDSESTLSPQPQLKRRDSAVKTPQPQTPPAKGASSLSKGTAKLSADVAGKGTDRDRTPERVDNVSSLEKGFKSLKITTGNTSIPAPPSAVSSGGSDTSSDGGSRSSEGTVTSDGGFTDYLSDESEAELQRQAEVRAAIMEQNRQEENEFRLARKQLANVDLRPPTSWTTGMARKAINTGYARGN